MIIKKLLLENFRSYQKVEIPFHDNINVIIGKNDVGKSSILEALDIFFDTGKIAIDISDKCIDATGNIAITVFFKIDFNKEYLIDTDNKTSLINEYLLNEEGLLEIRKEWDCTKEKLTATSLSTYLNAFYPEVLKDNPLPTLKITELKKMLEDKESVIDIIELSEHINNNDNTGIDIAPFDPDMNKKPTIELDKRKRAEIRKAIYEVLKTAGNLNLRPVFIPMNKEDGKNIYQALEKDFPQYELFQSDKENKDNEKDVQDPLKVVTKRVINDSQDSINDLLAKLKEQIEETSKRTLEKLREMNPELANELKAETISKDFASLFSYSFTSDRGIPLNKRGSGVRRLVLLNFLRAEAENKNTTGRNIIYALEEPETSQHADHQKLLMKAFKEISLKPNYQVIITTHSTNLLKMVNPDEIIFVKKENSSPKIIDSENIILEIATDLGTLPNLNSNIAVIVEGVTDKYFLENINQTIPEYKAIIDLSTDSIPIFWVGGSENIKNWVEKRPLKDLNMVEFHLYDSDGCDKSKAQIDKINAWNNGSFATQTRMASIENYLHPAIALKGKEDDVISAYFGKSNSNMKNSLAEKWNQSEWESLQLNWNTTINVSDKLTGLGFSKTKNYVTCHLVKYMTKDLLVELNVYDEIKGWFEKIKKLHTTYN